MERRSSNCNLSCTVVAGNEEEQLKEMNLVGTGGGYKLRLKKDE